MKDWIKELYSPIYYPITENKNLKISEVKYEPSKNEYSDVEIEFIKQHKLEDFYESLESLKLHWKTFESYEIKAEGSFDIYPVKRIMRNWDEDFGVNDWAPKMKGFKPLDMFFESNGCVGFYMNRPEKKGLYLYAFEGDSQPLNLYFKEYLQLLIISKGFGWWQNALVEISTGKQQPNVDSFKANMPKIFSDFNYEEFKNLYSSLRIDK